jgi:hypothetical protein
MLRCARRLSSSIRPRVSGAAQSRPGPHRQQQQYRRLTQGGAPPGGSSSGSGSGIGGQGPKGTGAAAEGAHAAGEKSQTTVQSILESTGEWNKAYVNMEASIMDRVHASNKQRFRVILLTTVVGIIWVGAVFGGKIRSYMSRQTADLAKETLENKSLQIQTQELATAVVQTILNDREVTLRASAFLREAVNTPETRDALLAVLSHVLQHPETKQTLTSLTKAVIADVAADQVLCLLSAQLFRILFVDFF